MTTIDDAIRVIMASGATPEQIAVRAKKLATEPIKSYFLAELIDAEMSPEDYCIQLSVSDWSCIARFFAKPTTELYHPQRIFQDIAADVGEALATQNAQGLILALMLGAKAVQP